MDQSKLTPQDQSILFQLMQKAGNQPVSGGMPVSQDGMAAPNQPTQDLQPLPGDKMHPAEAMNIIMGQMLGRNSQNQLTESFPASPIQRLFGKKTRQVPLEDQSNYFDTLASRVGEDAARALLPGGTPVTPEGKPYLSASVYDRLSSAAGKAAKEDQPNSHIGKLALAKLEARYGKDSPVYQNAKEAVDSLGGLPLKQFSEFVKTSTDEETPNFIKGANGVYQMYDRATKQLKPVPGQTTGILETLGDPASAKMFDTKLQDFNTDPVVKQLKTTLDALSNSSSLLESNNPAALGSFFGNIARSVGLEKGPLNEGDIQRAVGDGAYGSQLYRWLNKRGLTVQDFGKGKFSDADLRDFRGLLRDMGESTNKRYDAALNRHVGSVTKTIPGLTDEFVRNAFDTANRFMPGEERRLKGQATNYSGVSEGTTKSGVKYKVIK